MRFTAYREVEAPDVRFLQEVAGDVLLWSMKKATAKMPSLCVDAGSSCDRDLLVHGTSNALLTLATMPPRRRRGGRRQDFDREVGAAYSPATRLKNGRR